MNIGVCLIGISLDSSEDKPRNYKDSIENYREKVLLPLKDNEVKIYTVTYEHNLKEEFLSDYKPHKYLFLKKEDSNQRKTYLQALNFLENEELDLIICTRFDIFFHKNVFNENVNVEKFNFCFKESKMWSSHNLVTDNLFIFPKKYLVDFIESLKEIMLPDVEFSRFNFLHNIYRPIVKRIGLDNINFLSDTEEFSDVNTFYKLIRKK